MTTLTPFAGLAAACGAGILVNRPSFEFFDRVVGGQPIDDMPVVELAPYVLVPLVAMTIVAVGRHNEWKARWSVLAAAIAGAAIVVLCNYLTVTALRR